MSRHLGAHFAGRVLSPPMGVATNRSLRALAGRNFRLYFTGQIVSTIGTWMQLLAQSWLVLQLTHSGVALGLNVTLQTLPLLVFGVWAGWDRRPRRQPQAADRHRRPRDGPGPRPRRARRDRLGDDGVGLRVLVPVRARVRVRPSGRERVAVRARRPRRPAERGRAQQRDPVGRASRRPRDRWHRHRDSRGSRSASSPTRRRSSR